MPRRCFSEIAEAFPRVQRRRVDRARRAAPCPAALRGPRFAAMTPRFSTFIGQEMAPWIPDLARLCTTVFRDWPHLYDGDGRYDTDHLQALVMSPRAALIIAYDGGLPVGASTCLPLEDATANVRAPFLARGWPPARYFYFAESVVLPSWRGRGAGAAFFAMREAHVRAVSHCDFTCFSTVERPANHPSRPHGPRPLDSFWRRRGYAPVPGLRCAMTWREIGHAEDSDLSLQFWIKALRPV